jgi:hypothetical protein
MSGPLPDTSLLAHTHSKARAIDFKPLIYKEKGVYGEAEGVKSGKSLPPFCRNRHIA